MTSSDRENAQNQWRLGALDELSARHAAPSAGASVDADAPTEAIRLPRRQAAPARVRLPEGSAASAPGSRDDDDQVTSTAPPVPRRPAPAPQLTHLPAPPTTDEYTRLSGRPAVQKWRSSLARVKGLFRSDPMPTELVAAATLIQQPLTTGRRVVVLGAAGGVGTTTLACALTTLIQRLRNDPVTLIVQSQQAPAVSARIGTSADSETSVWQWTTPAGAERAEALEQVSRSSAITVVDVGCEPASELITRAHAVVVVLPVSGDSAARAHDALGRIRAIEPDARCVLSLVDTGRDTGITAEHARKSLPDNEVAVIMPADRHLSGGAAINLDLCAEQTQMALHHMAAAVVAQATLR